MKTICEICGQYSDSVERCTNCGSEIAKEEKTPPQHGFNRWGWAIFNLNMEDASVNADAIHYLREKWASLEEFTVLNLLNSQAARFDVHNRKIKVLIREDFLSAIAEEISLKFDGVSVEFEPVEFETSIEANELLDTEWNKTLK
jgi:hypothetical protein